MSSTLAFAMTLAADPDVPAGGGDPRAGLQSIWLGVIIILAFVVALNYKRLGTMLAILGVIAVSATIVYAPASMWKGIGSAGSSLVEWATGQL